jgi:hypothetical protein
LSYAGLSETEAGPKEFVDVTITDATEYYLMGRVKKGRSIDRSGKV